MQKRAVTAWVTLLDDLSPLNDHETVVLLLDNPRQLLARLHLGSTVVTVGKHHSTDVTRRTLIDIFFMVDG